MIGKTFRKVLSIINIFLPTTNSYWLFFSTLQKERVFFLSVCFLWVKTSRCLSSVLCCAMSWCQTIHHDQLHHRRA